MLKSEGPMPNLTTYKAVFPGYKGLNQYVNIYFIVLIYR